MLPCFLHVPSGGSRGEFFYLFQVLDTTCIPLYGSSSIFKVSLQPYLHLHIEFSDSDPPALLLSLQLHWAHWIIQVDFSISGSLTKDICKTTFTMQVNIVTDLGLSKRGHLWRAIILPTTDRFSLRASGRNAIFDCGPVRLNLTFLNFKHV